MKKTNIGHVDCPICIFKDANVKEDKNGHAYVHCPDCNAQVFTRNDHRDLHLRRRMRPVTVTVTDTAPEAAPEAPVPVAVPVFAPKAQAAAKAPAKQAAKAPAPKPVPAPTPTPTPAKAGFWTPLMGGA
jgi:NMD protein affecting ribosome stability and mRNA decay